MNEEQQILRTVADFRSVPDAQLHNCLRAFRSWLDEERAAAEAGSRAPDAFVWRPQPRSAPQPAPTATTDIRSLGLRPSVTAQLARMNILALEDFSEMSAPELGRMVNVGATTVAKVRAMLQAVGLDFCEGEPAAAAPPRAAAGAPAGPADDRTPVAELGLRMQTARKAMGQEKPAPLIGVEHEVRRDVFPRAKQEVAGASDLGIQHLSPVDAQAAARFSGAQQSGVLRVHDRVHHDHVRRNTVVRYGCGVFVEHAYRGGVDQDVDVA